MRRVALWLGLALAVPALGGATDPSPPATTEGSAPAKCTVTLKARLDAGTLGNDPVVLWIGASTLQSGSKVRIKTGTWSKLGDIRFRTVRFNPDGTWQEWQGTSSTRKGTGQWTGQVQLNMGCRYNRRYEFLIRRDVPSGATVRPQYPSTSSWTKTQTIDLGNLARYF